MFANRFTALIDACVLAGALKRNLLLSLAEAEFFRVRWSSRILDETEKAIAEIYTSRGHADGPARAARSRRSMEGAFEDALVEGFEGLIQLKGLPDPDDAHVIEAAVKTQAAVIVTDNIRDFPLSVLAPLNLDVRTADDFLADTMDLNAPLAVDAIRRMRGRLQNPALTAEALFLKMEADGLTQAVDVLRPYIRQL